MNKKGLSLIEILISLAILSVIMVMTTPLILVKTRNTQIDTNAGSVWNLSNVQDENTTITLNPIEHNGAANTYPNFIVGASESDLTAQVGGAPVQTNIEKINDESGALYVYNQGSVNDNLPGITVSKTLFFLSNIIDGSTANTLTIFNTAPNTHYLTLSDNVINIRNRLIVDNKNKNIGIGNNLLVNNNNFIVPNGTKSVTVIGSGVANGPQLPQRDNSLYILAGLANNEPVVEADSNMIHITQNLDAGANTITANQIYFASDRRLKNVKGEYKKGLNEVLKINPVEFTYKADEEKKVNAGVIAQELKKILPEAVITRDDGYYAVKESPVFYALLNSVKELNSNYEKIKKNNDELEKQIALLKLKK